MAKLLKDLYNHKYIQRISDEIKKVYKNFDTRGFELQLFDDEWQERELKQRMRHISKTLGLYLPERYTESIDILKDVFVKISPQHSLENMIFQDFVEVYGLNDFDTSMEALEIFTIGSTSEFAIREFILKYPQKSMKQMQKWALSPNEHVRRLASEGCRSRLPWAIALKDFKNNPSEVIKILELLKDDESAYVRKSVANSLNDISKDNPDVLKKIARRWINENKNRDRLLKHACRTLLKSGDKELLELFGFKKIKDVKIEDIKHSKSVSIGDDFGFSFRISSKIKLQKIRVEYIISFLRSNGTYSKKVFKICEGEYDESSKKISKKHSFKIITTRKYYSGMHKIEFVVNGDVLKQSEFILKDFSI